MFNLLFMIARSVVLIVLVLSCSSAFGQHMPANGPGAFLGLNITDHMLQLDTRRFLYGSDGQKIEGTPYLNEEFATGDVLSNKGKFTGIELRYNLYSGNIEFKQRDIVYALVPGPEIKRINFGQYSFVVENYESKGQKKDGYYVLLDSGKVTLVAKKHVSFREAQAPKALETMGKPPKYISEPDEYYYRVGTGNLINISNVKKLIEGLPDKQDELKAFASKEKISKNARELTELIKYYNSL